MPEAMLTSYLIGFATWLGLMTLATVTLVVTGRRFYDKRSGWLDRWKRLQKHLHSRTLSGIFKGPIGWLSHRLSGSGFVWLNLVVGGVIILCLSWLFGEISENVMEGDPLTELDQQLSDFFHEHRTTEVTAAMKVVTEMGSASFITLGTILAAVLLLIWKGWYRLGTLMLAVPGGALMNLLLKYLIKRDRPFFENPILSFSNYSFPSGHTMGATLFYGVLAAFVIVSKAGWKWKVGAVFLAALIVQIVGFSRIYLGAHFLSDVVAAATAGIAWMALCVTVMDAIRRRRMGRDRIAR